MLGRFIQYDSSFPTQPICGAGSFGTVNKVEPSAQAWTPRQNGTLPGVIETQFGGMISAFNIALYSLLASQPRG